jgi:hypothetical protein
VKKSKNAFCLLKTRISEPNPTGSPQIVNPEPMPVEVALAEEFRPIFDLLSSGVTDKKEYEKVLFLPSSCHLLFVLLLIFILLILPLLSRFRFKRCQVSKPLFVDGRIDMCIQVVGSKFIGDLCSAVGTGLTPVRHFYLGTTWLVKKTKGLHTYVSGPLLFLFLFLFPLSYSSFRFSLEANFIAKNLPIETFYLAGNCISATSQMLSRT